MDIVCPECGREIRTKTVSRFTSDGWAVFFVLLFITFCIFPPVIICICIPFFIDSLYETTHFCPKCNEKLGTNKNN